MTDVQVQIESVQQPTTSSGDSLWYKDAVIYELHVRSFHDSTGDGIGDFPGLTAKLDYLRDLGVTAVWLLPFYPSPLRDDGYDIADYIGVNPAYGTLRDVRKFVSEAHRRGIRVITELVINHTSDQHAWFQRARRASPGSKHRDFYVWSDTQDRYADARIIFKDFETSNWTWDPVAKAYYWHRFYSHQPDLNFDNPAVHDAVFDVLDQWMGIGVDGLRLDAIPYLYERDGTSCENLPETHAFLRRLRAHVDAHHPGRVLLAEANQWPEDAIAYFGAGDECHMAFHFPVMPRLFMAIRMEDSFPIVDILKQTPAIPESCQWAMFLRNHDELTLEMVTDEERDYMYRVYAADRQARINLGIRRRLAPLLGNNRRKIELMNGLLFSLPGTPVLYYGDEIGMGDNIYLGDRNGVRTPMQWSGDRNAGFSRANPQRLFLPIIIDPEYHYEAINVESQQENPSSLLWWMRRLIALRKRHPVFGRGTLELISTSNPKVLAFVRRHERSVVLVVANLSRFAQGVELDLHNFTGRTPIELFGRSEFPRIAANSYFISLGPHSFYWFSLDEPTGELVTRRRIARLPAIEPGRWVALGDQRRFMEEVIAEDLPRRRWFASKAGRIREVRVRDVVRIDPGERGGAGEVLICEVQFSESEAQTYVVTLAEAHGEAAMAMLREANPAVLAQAGGQDRVLFDAMTDPGFCRALGESAARRRRYKGARGEIVGMIGCAGRAAFGEALTGEVRPSKAEQSNSSAVLGDAIMLKVFRRIEPGPHPELEIVRHLSEKIGFPHVAELAGWLEYHANGAEPCTLGILQRYIANYGDGWTHALDLLSQFYENLPQGQGPPDVMTAATMDPHAAQPTDQFLVPHLSFADVLGRRTAELHAALADDRGDPAFAAEKPTPFYRRSLFESMRTSAERTLTTLRSSLAKLPADAIEPAGALLAREAELLDRLRDLTRKPVTGLRIRCHGDYHLGQVLWTGKDVIVIDFEGEPSRSMGERRLKRSPLRDVAGMLRSFDYASLVALHDHAERGNVPTAGLMAKEAWARAWTSWMSYAMLASYIASLRQTAPAVLPDDEDEIRTVLRAWLIEKALYEVRYELNARPQWVHVPLRGLLTLLEVPK